MTIYLFHEVTQFDVSLDHNVCGGWCQCDFVKYLNGNTYFRDDYIRGWNNSIYQQKGWLLCIFYLYFLHLFKQFKKILVLVIILWNNNGTAALLLRQWIRVCAFRLCSLCLDLESRSKFAVFRIFYHFCIFDATFDEAATQTAASLLL